MTMRSLLLPLILVTALAACATTPTQSPTDVSLRSGPADWCDLFTCEPCPSTGCPPGGEAVHYCCDEVGGCTEVPAGTTCPQNEFPVVCNWGMTNRDGSITCFDDTP